MIDKLTAIFDEFERVHQYHPDAAGFDRAIRAETTRHLHLAENSDSMSTAFEQPGDQRRRRRCP